LTGVVYASLDDYVVTATASGIVVNMLRGSVYLAFGATRVFPVHRKNEFSVAWPCARKIRVAAQHNMICRRIYHKIVVAVVVGDGQRIDSACPICLGIGGRNRKSERR